MQKYQALSSTRLVFENQENLGGLSANEKYPFDVLKIIECRESLSQQQGFCFNFSTVNRAETQWSSCINLGKSLCSDCDCVWSMEIVAKSLVNWQEPWQQLLGISFWMQLSLAMVLRFR